MYFRFLDDVMCLHNGANKPESTTSLFRAVRQVAAPEAKSAVSDCILLNTVLLRCDYYWNNINTHSLFSYSYWLFLLVLFVSLTHNCGMRMYR